MSKEHAGGVIPEGFTRVPFDWIEDDGTPIAITHFDFSNLDSIESCAREALDGDPVTEAFRRFVENLKRSLAEETRQEIFLRIVGTLARFQNQYMAYDLMKDCAGLAALEGKTGVDLARQWGVSKEDWQQNRDKMRALLGMRKVRTMRDDTARNNMRLRNYRRGGS